MKILYMHTTALDKCKANVLQVLHMCHAFSKLGHEVLLLLLELFYVLEEGDCLLCQLFQVVPVNLMTHI